MGPRFPSICLFTSLIRFRCIHYRFRAPGIEPALDHLELALKAAEGHEDVVKGFHMVAGELRAALERVGIQPFSPKGEPFDPNEHEAMAQQPVEDAEPGTVVEVYQSGYRINGAVLRPARVVVAA